MSSDCPLCGTPPGQSIRLFCLDFRRNWRYWRCTVCRLSWRDPSQRPNPESERAQYELHENEPADPAYRQFLQRVSEPLLAHLSPGARGLDFGAGPGPALAEMLAAQGHLVALYDPFFHPDTAVLQEQYDFITCTETAEHFYQPDIEFDRLHGLLKAGGLLALMTGRLDDDARFSRWHYRHDPTHVCFYRPETMEWIRNQYGYDRVHEKGDVSIFRKATARGQRPG